MHVSSLSSSLIWCGCGAVIVVVIAVVHVVMVVATLVVGRPGGRGQVHHRRRGRVCAVGAGRHCRCLVLAFAMGYYEWGMGHDHRHMAKPKSYLHHANLNCVISGTLYMLALMSWDRVSVSAMQRALYETGRRGHTGNIFALVTGSGYKICRSWVGSRDALYNTRDVEANTILAERSSMPIGVRGEG